MADSGARLARRVADQERLAALTLQAQELEDSFAAEDARADQEEAASLADFDQALAESLGQAVPDSPAPAPEGGAPAPALGGGAGDLSAFSVGADGGALRAVVGVLPPPPPVGQARYLTILGLLEDPATSGGVSAADASYAQAERAAVQRTRELAAQEQGAAQTAALLAQLSRQEAENRRERAEERAAHLASQDRAASLHADALTALTAKYDALAAKVEDKKEDREPEAREFVGVHEKNEFSLTGGRRGETSREPKLRKDYEQDEPFKLLKERAQKSVKESGVTSALDQCIYLERCNLGSIAEYLQDVILFLEDLAPELLARAIGTSAQPGQAAYAEVSEEDDDLYARTAQVFNSLLGIQENLVRPKMSLLDLFAVCSETIGSKTAANRAEVSAIMSVASFQVYGDPFLGSLPASFHQQMRKAVDSFRGEIRTKVQKALAAAAAAGVAPSPGASSRSNLVREASGRFGGTKKSFAVARSNSQVVSFGGGRAA